MIYNIYMYIRVHIADDIFLALSDITRCRVCANSHILYSHGTLCMIAFLLKVCFHIYLRQFKISFS